MLIRGEGQRILCLRPGRRNAAHHVGAMRRRRPCARVAGPLLVGDRASAGPRRDPAFIPHATLVIRKGYHRDVDSYSAFVEADKKTPTGLAGYLRARGIKRCYLAGLATDFCVGWSAMDARAAGFKAAVIEDASRGINLGGTGLEAAWKEMKAKGVLRIQSTDLA